MVTDPRAHHVQRWIVPESGKSEESYLSGIRDMPSYTYNEQLARGLQQMLRVNSLLRRVGLGSSELAEMSRELEKTREEMAELADYHARFNRHFSKEGWLAYGSLDFTVMKRAVDEYESGSPTAATRVLTGHFEPDRVGDQLYLLNGIEEVRVRRNLIDLALSDYKAGRHHAVVPVLLMVIDGAFNDALHTGFHADTSELEAWDSLTAADGAINDIKAIFQKGRRKTRTEPITLPYRNGILHGMDLGYDNEIVSAKCWCFLFVVADWIKDKKSEAKRREKFAEETRQPSLRELLAQIAENKRMKEVLDAWTPRTMTRDEVNAIGHESPPEGGSPEEAVLKFLELWSATNFGGMARLYWAHAQSGDHGYVATVRTLLGDVEVISPRLEAIDDEASALSQVLVTVNPSRAKPSRFMFRMIHESESGDVVPRGETGGAWRVVWAQRQES